MTAKLIRPLDTIEITHLPILIYCGPGIGKTSIAQTATRPFTLDFDKGIHRSAFRKDAMRFDEWSEVIEVGERGYYEDGKQVLGPRFDPFRTVVVDTGGKAIQSIIRAVLAESPKNGYGGNPSQQGWGLVGRRFGAWVEMVLSWGKDVVMVCHEEEETNAKDQSFFKPFFPGKMAWKAIHQNFDTIGRLFVQDDRCKLDFIPREYSVGKNAGQLNVVDVPDLRTAPSFLADLITKARNNLGKTAEASAATAKIVEQWVAWLAEKHDLDTFNGGIPEALELKNGERQQVTTLINRHAANRGWVYDKKAKAFVAQEESAA